MTFNIQNTMVLVVSEHLILESTEIIFSIDRVNLRPVCENYFMQEVNGGGSLAV